MFEADVWQEIFETIRKNKLRTFLTGFSVAWGIFMLMILLGSGNGLQNAALYQFDSSAQNLIWLNPGETTIPYHGLKEGRQIKFTNDDYTFLKEKAEILNLYHPIFIHLKIWCVVIRMIMAHFQFHLVTHQ
jgi:putative ABC transport system permease protein